METLMLREETTIIEAMQDVVDALCDLKNEYIKFPSTNIDVLTTEGEGEGAEGGYKTRSTASMRL